jgi:CRISP-associated protein Cas1
VAFRTIIIKSRCKLEYSLNYLILKKENSVTRVLIDEIKTLVIDSNQVVLTSALISQCIINKIKLIFSDSKHNPIGESVGYDNNFYTYRKIKEQITWQEDVKNRLWQHIIVEKIFNQAKVLKLKGITSAYDKLIEYVNNVDFGDSNNREGHAAKVYFNALFGKDFSRDLNNFENKVLNYGYSILLSCINREIKMLGYLTEIGIHHIGESNSFNLSCDFIEPLRPMVDLLIIKNIVNEDNFKLSCINLLSTLVNYNGQKIILENAIRLYVEDLMTYLKTGDESKIRFIEYEF